MYNSKKRALSVIATIIGLFLSLGAIVAAVLGIMANLGDKAEFVIGSSLNKMFNLETAFEGIIVWIILVAVAIIGILNFIICIKLLKKPIEIDEKFTKYGGKKFLFIIFTLISGVVIALQFFNKNIIKDDKLLAYVVMGVAVLVCLLQLISMFMSQRAKSKKSKDVCEKKAKADKKEDVCECSDLTLTKENQVAMFNSIPKDPVLDSFEQRIREVKHLRDAGLINDMQATAAVENIIDGFMS